MICFKCKSKEDVTLSLSGNFAMCGKCLTSGKYTTWEF
jgi:hypothetical protein